MTQRRYALYDVFTNNRLAGNPLAVVFDCDGLDGAAMQGIAREFNLSESSFVSPPEDPRHTARVRIFTPDYEMPFAGHPTIGTAIALAERDGTDDAILVLEENIGPIRCGVTRSGDGIFAEFDLAKLPTELPLSADAAAFGAALGLGPHEIGFENHVVSHWSAGVPYVLVPVRGLEIAAKARFDNDRWAKIAPPDSAGKYASAYVYCRETQSNGADFHARMFVPGFPAYEDPATGSAAAAFAGAVVRFDTSGDGALRLWIEQGIEMGRPSRIRLEIDIAGGVIDRARIGGHAVKVAEGALFV